MLAVFVGRVVVMATETRSRNLVGRLSLAWGR